MDRQIRSIMQNPGWTLVVEVPDQLAANHAKALYEKVMKRYQDKGYDPLVSVQVVRPGTRRSSDYDSLPMESSLPARPQLPPGMPVMTSGIHKY